MKNHLFHYRAKVRSVYDGDTIRVDIDLGMSIVFRNESVRLSRINAPELRGQEREQGLAARDYLRDRIEGKEIILQTQKDEKGKYGRFLVEVWIDDDGKAVNVNDEMVSKGFAVYKNY